MKFIYTLLLTFLAVQLFSQIPNADFERGSADSISSWQSGDDFGVLEFFEFAATEADTTVYAKSGDKFAILRSENAEPASFSATFPYSLRAAGFRGRYIYLHDDSRQRFGIEITFWKRNDSTNSLDTLAHRLERITTAGAGGRKFYDWLEYDMPINADYYRMNGQPDSCTIKFITDVGEYVGSSSVLLIDDITFSEETIASRNDAQTFSFSVYPNPTAGNAVIQSSEVLKSLKVFDLSGRLKLEQRELDSRHLKISSTGLSSGIYMLQINSEKSVAFKKLIIE